MYGQSSLGRYGRARQRAVRERQQDFSRAETGISASPDALDRNTTTAEQQVERQAAESRVARESFNKVVEKKKEEADDGVMGVVHTGLDIAGTVPLVGEVADVANAGLYLAEGNEMMAALSAAAAIPIAGWAATGAKAAIKGADALKGAKAVGSGGAAPVVYRGGSRSPTNLTPRPGKDPNGLSTNETLEGAAKPGEKAQVIETSRLNRLRAFPDAPPPGHVSIRPEDQSEVAEWAATRGNPDAVHPYTRELQEAIVGEVRRPK